MSDPKKPLRLHAEVVTEAAGLSADRQAALVERVARGDRQLRETLDRLLAAAATGDLSLVHSGGALAGPVWERLADELAAEPAGAEVLAPGDRVGRYLVLHPLGSGGMGAVYTAYDPELDRKVAVKVLHADDLGSAAARQEQERLRREAQALARLSHPNVVAVHDVGTVGGRVFLAMELVEGRDLKRWLAERPRSRREVLTLFRGVGQGLAAAHRSGLVHRDFKPQNVIVGSDGRPRILDFGLARAPDATVSQTTSVGGEPPTSGGQSPVTEADAIVGTPAYMAPEQLAGEPFDPRSDQYAFCLVLYEALYGELPFGGRTFADILEARKRGDLRPPPPGSRVPSWLRRHLARGLAPDPADRFPTLEALLAALARSPRERRLPWAAAAAGLVVAAALTWSWQRSRPSPCHDAAAALGGVWDSSQRARVEAGFAASGHPGATAALGKVARALDGYRDRWIGMRTEACEATHLRGEQSPELLDLRMACLDRRRDEMGAFVEALATADAEVVASAPEAALRLTPLAVCADARLLTAPAPRPREPARRRRLEALEARLASARARRDVGRPAEVLGELERLASDADALGWAPLTAEAWFLLGDLQEINGKLGAAEESLFRSWAAAVQGGHDEYVARALDTLIWLDGNDRGRLDAALRWQALAAAVLERIDAGPLLRAEYHNNLGAALQVAGRTEAARQEHQKALALRERLFGPDSFEVAKSLNNLGSVQHASGRFAEAARLFRQALEINRRLLGDHPSTAMGWSNLGAALLEQGEVAAAREAAEASLELRRRLFGEASPWVGVSLLNVGFAELPVDPEKALDTFAEAGHRLAATLPPDHPYQIFARSGRGRALVLLGRGAEAVPVLEGAVADWEASGAALPYDLAGDRFALARALWDAGAARERSLEEARRALGYLEGLTAETPLREEVETWLEARSSEQ